MTFIQLQNRIALTKISKVLFLFIFIFGFVSTYAQTGLNFQGVARGNNNVILASQQISLRLSVLQGSTIGTSEYTETRTVTTNAQGLFTVVIGDVGAISTLGNFTAINWKNTPKFLKIEMDAAAGNNFITMGTTQFQYVAYAQFANSVDAENIVGIVPVARGGTGATNLTTFKSSLAIDKINNTSDADKPISTKTQTALDLKLIAADTSKYTKQSYTDSSLVTKLKLSDTATMLSNRIGKDTLSLSARINFKANTLDINAALTLKANASDIATNLSSKLNNTDTSFLLQKADTITLSNRIDLKANSTDVATSLGGKVNTSDVTTSLASKVDKVIGKELSTNDYSNAEKTKLAAITGNNTGDQDLSAYATTTALSLKANALDVTTSLVGKVDKVTGKELSTNDYTTAEKSKLAAIVGTNTGDQDLSAYATNTALALKANTSDVLTGLANKVDKITGKELSTNDYTNAEKTKLAAIAGINTGDQDLTSYATNTALALKVNTSDVNTSLALKASMTDVATSLLLKEDASNKSTAVDLGGVSPSDILFPTQKAVKDYITANAASGYIQNATTQQASSNFNISDNGVIGKKLTINGFDLSVGGDGTELSNIAIGIEALKVVAPISGVGGNENIAIGTSALKANTNGPSNTAIGHNALQVNTTGGNNSAIGSTSLNNNSIGSANTSIGKLSLTQNTIGNGNTAIGLSALGSNRTGNYNTAIGTNADVSLNNLTNATAIGYGAIVTGDNTIQIGNGAVEAVNTSGSITAGSIQNTPIGSVTANTGGFTILTSSSDANVGGNLSVVGAISTVGSINANSGVFTNDITINGVKLGLGSGGNYSNAIFGKDAFLSNTSGAGNVAIGQNTLNANTIGSDNIAFGREALKTNSAGHNNIAAGHSSLYKNTIGTSNVALGLYSLYSNTEGNDNFSGGEKSLYSNTIGASNIALGLYSLYTNTSGNDNIAAGYASLYSNTDGSNNIALGSNALNSNTTGTYNTAIGNAANVASASLTNATAIGNGAIVNTSNTVQLGNSSVTSVITSGAITAPSFIGTLNGNATTATTATTAGNITATTNTTLTTLSSLISVGTIASLTTGAITNSGKVIVGASSAASASAVLEANSTTQGFLPPRMSGAQRNAILSKVAGLVVWCTNCGQNGELQVYNGTAWTNMIGGTVSNVILRVGDEYEGGIVAYILVDRDPGYDANIQHGLIAATSDQSSAIRWYNGTNTSTGATGTAIGTGLSNTNAIIASQGETATSYAAGLARAYNGGGYTDWYLPSYVEVQKIFLNRVAIGGFGSNYYWSSTEDTSTPGWVAAWAFAFEFNPVIPLNNYKSYVYGSVRAIRSF